MAQSVIAVNKENHAAKDIKTNKLGVYFKLNWFWLLSFVSISLVLSSQFSWIKDYPQHWQLPLVNGLNMGMNWFVEHTEQGFKAVAALLIYPMQWIRQLLQWLPWLLVVNCAGFIAYKASGLKLALFTIASLLYIVAIGLWEASMNSLALVLISVPVAVLLGFFLGVLGFASPRFEKILLPLLDIAQTIPAFAYLLPILLLFGFGPVVGLIASVLFAFAPMVRNTLVGLKAVDQQVIEAGLTSGATPLQLFCLVRYPSALKQILLGVNQTTMASLSMVIIASIIGGTADIGWEVLSTMRKAQFGESLVAGLVIVLLAMILDRITAGFAHKQFSSHRTSKKSERVAKHTSLIACCLSIGVCAFLAWLAPMFSQWPEMWVTDLSRPLNDAINWLISTFRGEMTSFKNNSLFFIMLPLKIGFDQAISPFTWGFALQPWHTVLYVLSIVLASSYSWYLGKPKLAICFATFAMVFYIGLIDFPWIAFIALISFLGFKLGGYRLALGTFLGLAFLAISGSWDKAMLSIYLCAVAVSLSALLGTTLGTLAASWQPFSHFMRPINDALQTLPPFVLLIPIVMLFKIGEFTALLAIVSYAYVPAFRYTEYGLRSVSPQVIEAATAMGTTPLQMLFQVKLPLALPNIMLGLNQSIMYGIAMLVIAALVGTNGLGQQVYIGLSKGDFGIGMVAGIGMAIIAIIADRFCQAWQRLQINRIG
ncbi:MAG: glycine betaine/proline transport system permease protein [Oceanospirillaceae bacterium]|jgi:glycine betaine/proline transport system permease protein